MKTLKGNSAESRPKTASRYRPWQIACELRPWSYNGERFRPWTLKRERIFEIRKRDKTVIEIRRKRKRVLKRENLTLVNADEGKEKELKIKKKRQR